MDNVLDKIIQIMKEKKISQKELCNKLGIPASQFTNWKNGQNKSYLKKFDLIAEVLGVDSTYLIGLPNTGMYNKHYELMNLLEKLDDEEIEQVENFIKYVVLKWK